MKEPSSTQPSGSGRLRRWATIMGFIGTAVLIHAFGPTPAQAHSTADAAVMERAAHSAKVLDIPGASNQAGTQLIQWDPHAGSNQLFRALTFGEVPSGPSEIHLVLLASAQNGYVLDVPGGSAEGASVVQNPWSGSASQVWWMAPFGDTGYTLYVNMGSGKVITVAGASEANGAPIVQGTWQGGLHQLWAHVMFIR